MIANNTFGLYGIRGLPGSKSRFQLAKAMLHDDRLNFLLYGDHWPANWNAQPLAYSAQSTAIRDSKVSVVYDHFPGYHGYLSDRFPIAAIAGRPFICDHRVGLKWIPWQEIGFFSEKDVKDIQERAWEIIHNNLSKSLKNASNAHFWAKNRLSHREAARYVISQIDENFGKLRISPWNELN